MDSYMPGHDNIQERLKTMQEECQRLREENVRLRAMLGIDHTATNEPVSQADSSRVASMASAGRKRRHRP
jgi:regulator of replication initiation timing